MKKLTLLFPHQLFKNNPAIHPERKVFLIEEYLFFCQYRFHKQKVAFHRASMKFYQYYLQGRKIRVEYIDAKNEIADIRNLIPHLKKKGCEEIHVIEPNDDWLEKRMKRAVKLSGITLIEYDSPMFLNSVQELNLFFNNKKKLLQTNFYVSERKRRNILLDNNQKPLGGKWTFDADNRLKYPKNREAPPIHFPKPNQFYQEACEYTARCFPNNPGMCDLPFRYPTTFEESLQWFQRFLKERFAEFGPYEDALVKDEHILHHSLLSPLLNIGLLTPQQVLDLVLNYIEKNDIPINSSEGFIRQLIGWREYMRGIYLFKGVEQRTRNFWNFKTKIPASFYSGRTGIDPLDTVIHKVLKTGYCHHIECLMILGNFMLLCEFNPDDVYRWFMEMFIDAYDWVMVPNVYGMSQFADGGIVATKPYISSSNYILKMSDFKKGAWQTTWDAMFWRFIHVHRDFFLQNPRLGMLIRTFDKMDKTKQKTFISNAEVFLKRITN